MIIAVFACVQLKNKISVLFVADSMMTKTIELYNNCQLWS